MDELLSVMQLIDKNADKLPEGDYLEICNRLKNAYNKRADPEFFFDYDNFNIPQLGPTQEVHDYFRNYYMDQAISLESDYLSGQIEYLRKELENTHTLKDEPNSFKKPVLDIIAYPTIWIPKTI